MPTYRKGDMFEAALNERPLNLYVTANATIKSNGTNLVMGCGAALQLRQLHPGLPRWFGVQVARIADLQGVSAYQATYGILHATGTIYGLFQVKHHFGENAQPRLIELSADILRRRAQFFNDALFFVNMPGVGAGRLKPEAVFPILKVLPSNVHIWSY